VSIRVLVADPHAVSRLGICTLLAQDPGIRVVAETGDGQEALDLAIMLLPDVVLLEVALPRVDGITVLRLLQRAHPAIRVIFLTAADSPEVEMAARAAGAYAYFYKKDDPSGLGAVLRSVHQDPPLPRSASE
jgi:DNA-binding NarL/FixJ family response regulator